MTAGTDTQRALLDQLDARFQERRDRIPVLRQRAADAGVTEIRSVEDLVVLLFPHTVYKSYPAALVDRGRWSQLNRWLDSVSARRVEVDVGDVVDVDGWVDRLAASGHFVAASSGTSGKSSFLGKSLADLDAALGAQLRVLGEADVAADNSWHVVSLGPGSTNVVGQRMRQALLDQFARPDQLPAFAEAPRTEGHLAYMTRLAAVRRAMGEGTANPDDVVDVEAQAARQQQETERRLDHYVREVLARPGERFLFGAKMAMAWRLVEALRSNGARPGDLTGQNAINMAGGTKGVDLPADHEVEIAAMLNVDRRRFVQRYSMQELNVGMPRCVEGQYHVPAGLVLLVLDEPGESLAPVSDGLAEGRAAFFDFTIDGRWGGTISGDRVRADFGRCRCGRPGPTVLPDIARFSNAVDGDKITCAATMDAYVRGFIAD